MAKHNLLGVSGSETIIGAGVELSGKLHSDGDIAIDGKLVGDIKAGGNVEIGVNAVIKSNIQGRNVAISGSVDGDIIADAETRITETGKLVGNITTGSIGIAQGAIFVGSCHMNQNEALEIVSEPSIPADQHNKADA